MKTALLFPGQGSQKVGMGTDLYQVYPEARHVFDQADSVLGFSLSRLCFEGPEAELTDTANAQPAILVTSLAVYAALGEKAPPADCVAGHSLGEYTALVVAGALAMTDAVRLTRQRGEWMKKAGEKAPGGMAAILNLEDAVLEEVCRQASTETGGVVQIANYNSPGQIVISGDTTALNRAVELAKERGSRRIIPLAVSVATHSPLMAYASDGLRQAIGQVTLSTPTVPVIANVTGKPVSSQTEVEQELIAQLTSPVRWTASVQEMLARGVQRFVEIGPGTVLTGLVRRVDKDAQVANISDVASLRAFLGEG
jgi:[acyl-carrier-protein] S-malonyltransferase